MSRLEVDFNDLAARIGIGTYGAVYVGRYFGELVAVKRVKMPDVSPAQRDDPVIQTRRTDAIHQFAREIRRYERISHPGIVRFLGVTIPPDSSALLITELMPGGSLADAVSTLRKAKTSFQISSVVRVALQACGGLRALHAANCTWGDAKPGNILLSAPVETDGHFPPSTEARIADFGLSKTVEQSLLADTTLCGTGQPAGTYNYMAPEAFAGANDEDESGRASDMYSFGMVMYEMITLRTPWRRKQLIFVFNQVMSGVRPAWPKPGESDYYDGVAQPLRDLVEQCWAHEPSARPTAEQVFDQLDEYSMTVSKRNEQRPVADIAGAEINNGMPRVSSKQSNASTAIAICDSVPDSVHASVELNGLESTRESGRCEDVIDDEDKHIYDNNTVRMTCTSSALPTVGPPRVSPVTSPEPRSLNARYAERVVRSLAPSHATPQTMSQNPNAQSPRSALGPSDIPLTSQDQYKKDQLSSAVHHDLLDLSLERALRDNASQYHPHSQLSQDHEQILEDLFIQNDLHNVISTDYNKHRDDLTTTQAGAHISNFGDSEDPRSTPFPHDGVPNPGNTYEANTVDLSSSLASSTSRRKRSKRIEVFVDRFFLEIQRRKEVHAKLPPKVRKEMADKRAFEEARKKVEHESLRVIESAKESENFSIVIAEMRQHHDSHAVSKEGTIFLSHLCGDENLYFDICEEGGVEEMASAASLYGRDDPSLCITFFQSISALSEKYDDKVGHLVRGVGVPSLIIELLDHHTTEMLLQTAGCNCLAVIASSSELSRSAVATLGGPACVYRAMTKNNTSFKDIDLARAALKAVRQIAQDNERAAEFLVQVAALDTVSRAAEVFTIHNLESDILAALRAFSFYNGGRRNIIMSSGLKALTSIMHRNRDPEFMVECCTFIRAIARWRDHECEEAMLQSCISERITELMVMSNDIPGEEGARVAWYASHACTFLASFGSKSRKRLRLVGAIETALSVLNHRRANARVVHSATDALAELMKGEPESKRHAQKFNAIAYLNDALETHAGIVRVRNALQWTLDHLTSSNDVPAAPAFGSRVYNELMNNMANNEMGPQQGHMQISSRPPRRFLGFNFGRRRQNAT